VAQQGLKMNFIKYYKEYNGIASINEATIEVGKGLIQSVGCKV